MTSVAVHQLEDRHQIQVTGSASSPSIDALLDAALHTFQETGPLLLNSSPAEVLRVSLRQYESCDVPA